MTSSLPLTGKVAVVTGGAGKLGSMHCTTLQQAGAHVWSLDKGENPEFTGIEQLPCDITNESEVQKAIDSIATSSKGKIDILLNNAAYEPPKEEWLFLTEYPLETWRKDLSVQLDGAFLVTRAVYPFMEAHSWGRIICVSSTSGITATNNAKYPNGMYKYLSYFPGKHGIIGFAKAVASQIAKRQQELSKKLDITSNVLAPGAVNFDTFESENLGANFIKALSGRNMLGRPATPQEYAGALVFLASNASAFMTAQTLIMDGGQTSW